MQIIIPPTLEPSDSAGVQGQRQSLAESSNLLLQLPNEEVGSQVGWSFHHHQSHLSHHHQTLPLCTREKYLPIVSVSSICPYIPDEIAEHPQPPQPSPVTINDQEEYEVEEILDSRFRWGKLWYLVKFVGWSNLDNMWLPHTEVHAPAIVNGIKWYITQIQYEMRPGLDGTSSL